MKPKCPCSPTCEKRSGICHSVCEDWKVYEEARNRWYAEEQKRREAKNNSYITKPYYKGKYK